MIDQELIDALKTAKEVTRLSEGAQIREALIEWFKKKGVKVKPAKGRARTRPKA